MDRYHLTSLTLTRENQQGPISYHLVLSVHVSTWCLPYRRNCFSAAISPLTPEANVEEPRVCTSQQNAVVRGTVPTSQPPATSTNNRGGPRRGRGGDVNNHPLSSKRHRMDVQFFYFTRIFLHWLSVLLLKVVPRPFTQPVHLKQQKIPRSQLWLLYSLPRLRQCAPEPIDPKQRVTGKAINIILIIWGTIYNCVFSHRTSFKYPTRPTKWRIAICVHWAVHQETLLLPPRQGSI